MVQQQVQKQKHKAPKPNTLQNVYQEGISPLMPEAISLNTQVEAVEEKQSYAMVTGLLQVLVHMQCPRIIRQPADLLICYQGGQHCLPTVRCVCCSSLRPAS